MWQLTGVQSLDEILLERQKKPKGVTFDQHEARQPKAMIEGEGDPTKYHDRQA